MRKAKLQLRTTTMMHSNMGQAPLLLLAYVLTSCIEVQAMTYGLFRGMLRTRETRSQARMLAEAPVDGNSPQDTTPNQGGLTRDAAVNYVSDKNWLAGLIIGVILAALSVLFLLGFWAMVLGDREREKKNPPRGERRRSERERRQQQEQQTSSQQQQQYVQSKPVTITTTTTATKQPDPKTPPQGTSARQSPPAGGGMTYASAPPQQVVYAQQQQQQPTGPAPAPPQQQQPTVTTATTGTGIARDPLKDVVGV
jgi:cytoskeletal protein RodZ